MGNSASLSPWSSTYDLIKETHDVAYRTIEAAITLEEQEKPHEDTDWLLAKHRKQHLVVGSYITKHYVRGAQKCFLNFALNDVLPKTCLHINEAAIEKYKEGILLIDKALDIQIACPENPDFTWERARVMIQKMKKSRAEVLMRINCITSAPNFVPQEPPPSYEEAISTSSVSSDIPRTYTALAVALNDLPIESVNDVPAEIIYSHDDVRLYFISPDGTVTQTSEPQTLNIAVIPGGDGGVRTVFLQIGDWIYPLVPGVSPCYRTDYGAFILPDLHSDIPGSSIGIILPSDADASIYELLENILHGVISQETSVERADRRRREAEPAPGISGAISNGLVTGAYYISQGLIKGAQKAGSLISYGTPKIISSLTPVSEAAPVPPTLTKGLEIASSATGTAAHFTGYVADKVGSATQALGRFLAPHIQKQGTRLLTSGFNISEEEASSKVTGVLTVAAGAVEGFSTIYRGLETSASILGNNLSNNTVKIVQHKYGAPAGQLASNTLNTVGNVITIGHNSRFFTPKGLVKNAAKQTGKAMVQDARTSVVMQRQHSSSITDSQAPTTSVSLLYPNLHPMRQVETSTSFTATANHHLKNVEKPLSDLPTKEK